MTLLGKVPEVIKEPVRRLLGYPHPFGLSRTERKRLSSMPRFTDGSVQFFGGDFRFCDAASFLSSHNEIFVRRIYHFEPSTENPLIIDAGANIGLAALYFDRYIPNSRVISIESDPRIANILTHNKSSYGMSGVEVMVGAAWRDNGNLKFQSDHADAGHISDSGTHIVRGIRVKELLDRRVEFLKIDIEGAETVVLTDCQESLEKVNRIFVEYHSVPGSDQTLAEILSILSGAGFRYYIERTGVCSGRPLMKHDIESGFDLQLNIFAINKNLNEG